MQNVLKYLKNNKGHGPMVDGKAVLFILTSPIWIPFYAAYYYSKKGVEKLINKKEIKELTSKVKRR